MFEIIDDPQFVEDVKVDVPDGEGWKPQTLRTRFRVLRASDTETIMNDVDAVALLERIVIQFEDLCDQSGKPVPGDGEWRSKLLDYGFVRVALVRAYFEAVGRVRSGNSASSAAPGLAPN